MSNIICYLHCCCISYTFCIIFDFEIDIYLDTIALIRTSAFNDGILRIVWIVCPRPPEPSPGVLGVHGEVLLVLVVEPVLVEVQHDHVADDRGDREQRQARAQVQQQRDQRELARLAVHVHDQVDAVRLVERARVVAVILGPPVVEPGGDLGVRVVEP